MRPGKTGLGDGMRLLVCSGRHFADADLVEGELDRLHDQTPISVIIHGGIPGLGVPVENWARRHNVRLVRYPSNFSLGKRGDFERDDFMLEDSRPAMVLAFSGGTRTTRLLARAAEAGVRLALAACHAPSQTCSDRHAELVSA